MRAPVRSAPPPPMSRPAVIRTTHHTTQDTIKRPVLEVVDRGGGAPPRPARAQVSRTASGPTQQQQQQQPTGRRHGVRPPPKKKPPPRPPPPKLKDTPPSYEEVLREDAAALADFGFTNPAAGGRGSAAPSRPATDDLIDFDAPAPVPAPVPAPAVPLTWDSPPTVVPRKNSIKRQAAAAGGSQSSFFDSEPAPVPSAGPTVIRPAKPASGPPRGASSGADSGGLGLSATLGSVRANLRKTRAAREPEPEPESASPPMPSVPPPPPPALGDLDTAPELRPPTPPPRPGSSASSSEQPQALALYDFQSDELGDLSFMADQTVQLVSRVNADWLRGRCQGREGIFPAGYVYVTVPLPGEDVEPLEPQQPERERALSGDGLRVMALYDFQAQEQHDLGFKAGDYVLVQGKLNADWGYGSRRGQSGQFPLAYLDVDPAQLPDL